eukprot:5348087-Prymnesium_polylepis.1
MLPRQIPRSRAGSSCVASARSPRRSRGCGSARSTRWPRVTRTYHQAAEARGKSAANCRSSSARPTRDIAGERREGGAPGRALNRI